jgi:signal transduction histidine kinase
MRLRLIAVLVGVVVLVLAVQDVPLIGHLRTVERDRVVTRLERDAFILGGRAEEALESGTVGSDAVLAGIVERYQAEEQVSVVVVDSVGVAVLGPDFDRGEDFTNRPEIVTALTGRPATGERQSTTLGDRLFYVAVPVLSGDSVVGAVRITTPAAAVDAAVAERVRALLLVLAISLVIAVFAAWVLAWTVTRPVARLTTSTARLAGGDLSTRADERDGPPEIRGLARAFNSMAGQIGELVDRQRQFAGTASHQLRTPLTALRVRLESLADGLEGEQSAHAEAAIAETDRLRRMIEGLLILTRVDDTVVPPVAVDLAAKVRERAEYWEPLAAESSVRIDVIGVESAVMVSAVPGAVEQIIDNLVDNALDVSPSGGELRLEVRPVADGVELHIVDQGPGLGREERSTAFDRFWRGERATAGGSGLGLAIVRQLANAGGGSAELLPAESGGIDAVVRFVRP